MLTNFLTWQLLYLCAESDGRVVANRPVPQGWETFIVFQIDVDRFAYQTDHGTFLCAEPDGRLVHRRPGSPDGSPGAWETFRNVIIDGNVVAQQTAHGTYIVVELDGTVQHRTPGGNGEPGAWESFVVTPWWNTVQPGVHPDPIVGAARLSNSGYYGLQDDLGQKLVWGVHAGDLLAAMYHGKDIDPDLAHFREQGAHFLRTWTYLYGNWWATPPRPGEIYPALPDYWEAIRTFARKLREYKLQWLVSQGDLFRNNNLREQGRREFMSQLASTLASEGGLELVIGVDAGNENASAGNPDAETMARTLDPFLATLRPAMVSTTSNDENDLNRYVSRVCTVVDSHHGRWPYRTAIERAWAAGYWDGKYRPLISSSEPVGVGCQEYAGDMRVGHHISATAVPADWDDIESMSVLAAAHFVSRQIYTYLSSPGVISDEPFSNYPALAQTGWLARRLPRNIQSWRIFHGGDNRSFSGDRVLGVPLDNEARCEHATNGQDYVVLVHGADKTHNCRAINEFSGVRIDLTTREETPVSWRAGETVPVAFRRGTLFIGTRQ